MFEKKALARRQETPFNLLRQMTSELDRMFDEPWTFFQFPVPTMDGSTWTPKVDVITSDNKLVTRVDLPGVTKEDVNVEVVDGMLILSGERKKETKEEKNNYYREEREYGGFRRTVPLPKDVKAEDVKATFINGVLEVAIPLPAAVVEPKARKIEIGDGGAAVKAA